MSALPSSALEDRILARALAARIALAPEHTAQLASYYRLLERWNRKINLTSLPLSPLGDDADRSIDKLIVEPLAATNEIAEVEDAGSVNWIDFGTGGGSPAIPLKVLRPRSTLTMVEARERKTAFLREVVSTLGLADARVLTMRIEVVPDAETRGVFDLITARAVKFDADITASAAALLKPDGRLVVFGSDMPLVFNELLFRKVRELSLAPGSGLLSVFSRTEQGAQLF